MTSGQVLPGIVHSPALGSMLREYLASCTAQPVGLGGGGAGAQVVGVTDAAVERNTGTRPRATSVAHQAPVDVALVARRGQITEKMLRDHFHLPLHTVAKKFGMCTTALQKLCRRFEIPTRAGRLGRSEQHQCRFCGQTSRAFLCARRRNCSAWLTPASILSWLPVRPGEHVS